MKAQDYQNDINFIEAQEFHVTKRDGSKKPFYTISAVLNSGEKVVIKQKSTRAPAAVQLYKQPVNNNAYGKPGQYFLFAKSIDSWYREHHLKSYQVTQAA